MNLYFVISPSKEMKLAQRKGTKLPIFEEESKELLSKLKQLTLSELMSTMKLSEKIAKLNQERYQNWRFDLNGGAAMESYQGMQYRQIGWNDFSEEEEIYFENHVRILSGLYGVVTPLTAIYPYRLEMAYPPFALYSYWKDAIGSYFQDSLVYDVASEEYGKLLPKNSIKIQFKMKQGDRLFTQSTQVKKARGLFLHYLAKHQITKQEDIIYFCEDGYHYQQALSDENHIVFVKEK